jgi:putative ABC transport system permease protein
MKGRRMFYAVRARLRAIRPRRAEDDLRDELAFHVAMEARANVARGMSPDEARRAAQRQLGNATRIREELHELGTIPALETLAQDLRYGLRVLRKTPVFAVVAIATLALGTGANAAIFQLVNALRLRPLPVEKPHELLSIRIDQHGKGRVGRGYPGGLFTEPLWQEIRAGQQAFSSLIAWGSDRFDLSTEGETVWARGLYVSGRFFDTLGVGAGAGRILTEADDQKGCAPVAVLAHDFWQARYGGDPGVIGQRLTLDRHPFEVIGVARAGFFGVEVGRTFDVAIPLCAEPLMRGEFAGTGRRAFWWLDIMGRLKPDWTAGRAQAHLAALSPGIFSTTVSPTYKREWAENYASFTLTANEATTGISSLRTAYATQLWALLGATGLVLLLTCANLANLMLARATVRSGEIAVRLAIGASRGRVIRQMLSESALVAAFGALGGVILARWISQSLVRFLNVGGTRIFVDLSSDWRVFTFLGLSAVLTCALFGVNPAVRATRRGPAASMQSGGRTSTEGHDSVALRRGLVVVQVALSMVLVVGALLFARTLKNLASVDLGFDPRVMVASIDLRRASVQPAARAQAFADIAARFERVPGVRAAAETLIVPLSGPSWNGQIVMGGAVQDGDVFFNQIGGRYFNVMGTPILAGRTFDGRDRPDGPTAAVVNETFARRYLPKINPVGQTFQLDVPRTPLPTYHIVGLVKDAKYLQVRQERVPTAARFSANDASTMFLPIVYLAASQDTMPPTDFRIVLRADVEPGALLPSLTHEINATVPGAAVSYDQVATYIDTQLVTERLMAWLSGFFGVLAVLIAAIGLYGVMSYLVTRRRLEIGVRMALGADAADVMRLVLAESGALIAAGLGVGTGLAYAASRSATTLLYGLTPLDPVSFAVSGGVLLSVSVLAAAIPAVRASRLDPTVALRE